jgi:AcrR family transcriptional regulator
MVRSTNRRGEGGRLRADLLDAATAIVAEGGAGLSLRAVAARAGVATTSVYLHFADLQAIRSALGERGFIEFGEACRAAGDRAPDPLARVIATSQAHVRWAMENPGLYRMMFSPELGFLATDAVGPSRTIFDSLVASVARVGRDDDPQWTATLLWSALHGQAKLRVDRPRFPWPPADEMVADLVRRLVVAPTG